MQDKNQKNNEQHPSDKPQQKYPEFIKKGYFVDIELSERNPEWQIYDIDDTKIFVRNLREQNYRAVVDLKSESTPNSIYGITLSKIKRFRTISRVNDILIPFHRTYNYWSTGINNMLPMLRNLNLSTNLCAEYNSYELVHFLRGKNYFIFASFRDASKITYDKAYDLKQYTREFLKFVLSYVAKFRFAGYLDIFNFNDQNLYSDKLYESPQHALILSYPQIFISLSMLFMRQSFLQVVTTQYKFEDQLMVEQLKWLDQKFIPALNQNICQMKLPYDGCMKLLSMILKLLNNKKIFQNQQTKAIKIKLISQMSKTFSHMPYSRFGQAMQQMNEILQLIDKTSEQFMEILKCKLKLLIRLQQSIDQYVLPSRDKYNLLFKHANFLLSCNDYPELHNLIQEYLGHNNGLPYLIRNASIMTHLKDLIRCFKRVPKQFIKICLNQKKQKKSQILRHLSEGWTIDLLQYLLSQCLSTCSTMDKDDILTCINVHKTIIAQKKKILSSSSSLSPSPQKLTQAEFKQIQLLLAKLEVLIVRLCQMYFDANQRTMIIGYVQNNIVQQYVRANIDDIANRLSSEETNQFHENIVLKNYFQSIFSPATNSAQSYPPFSTFANIFIKLCDALASLRTKSNLQSRKQVLNSLLKKCDEIYPSHLVEMLCYYIAATEKVQNRQFKIRAFSLITQVLFQAKSLQNDAKLKAAAYKKIMPYINIESIEQLRIYLKLSYTLNYIEQTAAYLSQQSCVPIVLYARPFGFDKLIKTIHSNPMDKLLSKKIFHFFNQIHLKIADQQFRDQIVWEIIQAIFQAIQKVCRKKNIQILQENYLIELIDLLQSLFINGDSSRLNNPETQYLQFFRSNRQSYRIVDHASSDRIKRIQKVKIRVILDSDIEMENSQNADQATKRQQNEITEEYRTQINDDQYIFELKAKACQYFELPIIFSDLYYQQELIKRRNQIIKINDFKRMRQNNQTMQNQTNENLLVFHIQVQKVQNTAFKLALANLDVIYLALPWTQRLWARFQIKSDMWSTDPKLIKLKQEFLSSYIQVDPNTPNMVQNEKWSSIMQQPLKKRYILQGLISDPNIRSYRLEWLIQQLSSTKQKSCITNDLLTIKLIKMLCLTPTIINRCSILIKFLYLQNFEKFRQNEQNFVKLSQEIFSYIDVFNIPNFELFSTLIKEYQCIYTHVMQFQHYCLFIGQIYVQAFYRQLLQSSTHAVYYLMNLIQLFPEHFSSFLAIFANKDYVWEASQDIRTIFIQFLHKSCLFFIQNSTQNQKFLIQPQVRTLLQLIWTLMKKGIQSEIIFSIEFRNLLQHFLYSKHCTAAIQIIYLIVHQNPNNGVHYIQYFHKQMIDPQMQKRQQLKFNHNSLRHWSGHIGLVNPHSVCYANSLLQQLYHIPAFRTQLLRTNWKKAATVQEDLIYQLKKIFINLNLRQSDSYLNRDFFEAFKNDEGSATSMEVQMDVDQFRNILFDRIQNTIVKPQRQDKNFVQKLFNGKQKIIIKSKDCEHESSRQQDFSSICLQVKGLKNLESALQNFFRPQILKDDNKYFCEDCNKKVVAQKKHSIKEYPQFLTFVLKRFDYMYQYKRKINQRFEFPFNLFKMADDASYLLKGIIVHQGLSEAGHYFSMIRLDGIWYEFNDNYIAQVAEADVQTQSFGQSNARSNRNAYLLIYQLIPPTPSPSPTPPLKLQPEQQKILPYLGLDQQILNIKKHNNFIWKLDLFLCPQFDKFIINMVELKIPKSIDLLFQYFITIKAKCKIDVKNVKNYFKLFYQYEDGNGDGDFVDCQQKIDWVVRFYKNYHFHQSAKSQMTKLLISKYKGFNANIRKLLASCLIAIHEEIQTAPFFNLFLAYAQADHQILKFLCDNRLVGRIYDISFTQVLLTLDRQQLSKSSTQISFPLLNPAKLEKKRIIQSAQLRYHKWRLLNFIIESKIELHKIEESYMNVWSSRKCEYMFEDATTKPIINKISEFFCLLSKKNPAFNCSYLSFLKQELSKLKSQNARKYLKATSDLLNIKDNLQQERIKIIKDTFAETFEALYKQKIMSSFDVKWQWFIKMLIINPQFREAVRASQEEFKILFRRQELQLFYQSRNEMNSEGKSKNKYYGLKFSISSVASSGFLQEKLQKTRLLLSSQTPASTLESLREIQTHIDTDLTSYPQIQITSKSPLLKYQQHQFCFKEVSVEDSVGDLIIIQSASTTTFVQQIDRGSEKFLFPISSIKGQSNNQIQTYIKEETVSKSDNKVENDMNQNQH